MTLERTASRLSCLLALSAMAVPVALARDDDARQARVTFRAASYTIAASRDPSRAATTGFGEYPQFGLYVPGDVLLSRLDVGTSIAAAPMVEPAMAPASESDRYFGFELPRPNRWSSVLAALALIAFFFMRRIV